MDNLMDQKIPSIDLHGENKDTARILTEQFINDAIIMGKEKIMIIHGIGTGILKKEVQEVLKRHKKVDKFYIDFFNVGCTVVELKKIVDKNK